MLRSKVLNKRYSDINKSAKGFLIWADENNKTITISPDNKHSKCIELTPKKAALLVEIVNRQLQLL